MCYYVMKANGNVVSRTMVQRIKEVELGKETTKQKTNQFNQEISTIMETKNYTIPENDENMFYIHNKDDNDDNVEQVVPDAKDVEFSPETMDTYVGSEIQLPNGDGFIAARVVKRARDNNGNPIGRSHSNPILDTCLYEVKQANGARREIQANVILENMFAQADLEGRQFMLLNKIVSHKSDGTAIKKGNKYIQIPNRQPKRKLTTRGWKLSVRWKDGLSDWVLLADLKESFPVDRKSVV